MKYKTLAIGKLKSIPFSGLPTTLLNEILNRLSLLEKEVAELKALRSQDGRKKHKA